MTSNTNQKVKSENSNDIVIKHENKPELKPDIKHELKDMDKKPRNNKLKKTDTPKKIEADNGNRRKLEADFSHYLMNKYFSDKDIYGGSVHEGSTVIKGQTIKTSKFHVAASYADPVQYLRDKKSSLSAPAENQTSTSKGKLSKEAK